MKRIILLLSFVLTFSMCAFSQKANGGANKAKKAVEKLDAVLNLSEEQEAKILEFYSLPKEQRGKIDVKMKSILTEEQFKKYKEYRAEEKAKRAEKGERKGNKKKE